MLLRAGATVSEGMLANTADTGTLEYNTADAALWFLHADRSLRRDDRQTWTPSPSWPTPWTRSSTRHRDGTRYGIAADPSDGLLRQGAPGFALTWMDARVNGLTGDRPRGQGRRDQRAVDRGAVAVDRGAVREAGPRQRLAGRGRPSRDRLVPAPLHHGRTAQGLYDVVDGPAGDDASVRPNQLLAASLPHGPVMDPRSSRACRSQLLTSVGLRSLAPATPATSGRTAADRPTATAPTTRARCGPG